MSQSNLSSLLILPTPPASVTPETLKAAYQPSITGALTKLSSLKLSRPALLQVLLPYPDNYNSEEPRSRIFNQAQHLLAGLYSLICIVCARQSIEPEGPGGVDARVILLNCNDLEDFSEDSVFSSLRSPVGGPIIDLQTFALTRRCWKYIFSVDGEQGQELFKRYMDFANHTSPPVQGQVYPVQGGISLMSPIAPPAQPSTESSSTHAVVAVGGTFDNLHVGHKLLLTATALMLQPATRSSNLQRRLIVGITGDSLLKNKKYAEYLQSWKQRQEDVVDFLVTILSFAKSQKEDIVSTSFDEPVVNGRGIHTLLKQAAITIECVEIQDPFGPTITDESVSALVVSGETRSGGAAVNTKREDKGWKSLEIFEVDVLDAQEEKHNITSTEEFAAKISSTAIRKRKAENAHGPSL
jgi:phosphopantetheine adenylyltransferase